MKRDYYVLSSCDEWKSYSSMKLVGVFTLKELKKVVKRKVKEGYFEFGRRNIMEIDNMDGSEIDSMITYGSITRINLNEEQ